MIEILAKNGIYLHVNEKGEYIVSEDGKRDYKLNPSYRTFTIIDTLVRYSSCLREKNYKLNKELAAVENSMENETLSDFLKRKVSGFFKKLKDKE